VNGLWLAPVALTAGVASFLAVATGCGQGGSAYATLGIMMTQASAYAEAVNLHEGDIKGYKVELASGGNIQSKDTALGSCGTENSKQNEVAKFDSPTLTSTRHKKSATAFNSTFEQVNSSVHVMKDSVVALRDYKLFATMVRRRKTTECLARSLEKLRLEVIEEGKLAGKEFGQPLFSHVRVSALFFPQKSALGGIVGLRIIAYSWLLRHNSGKGPNYFVEDFTFSTGPATVMISYVGSPRPVPVAVQRKSLLLVYRRARANSVGLAASFN